MSGEFLDTNVLVYAFTDDPRSTRAQELLERRCVIAVQVLNEFANVARRKLGMTWPEVTEALSSIRVLCPTIVPMTLDIHDEAVAIAARYNLQIFDALMIASALHSGCETLWTEDMHDGLVVGNRLRLANPFAES
jgi:predicted nucleic acid-binding protein